MSPRQSQRYYETTKSSRAFRRMRRNYNWAREQADFVHGMDAMIRAKYELRMDEVEMEEVTRAMAHCHSVWSMHMLSIVTVCGVLS